MDDIYKTITDTFNTQDFKNFTISSEQFKIVHRCLDGVGINYDKGKILSVKAYCKILDNMPKFSDNFLSEFAREREFRSEVLSLSTKGSECMLNRDTGLAGINIGIKRAPNSDRTIRSVYVKTNPKVSHVLNYDGNMIREQKYYYVFNRTLQAILNFWFKFKIPRHNHALEFSNRGSNSFATVYPIFPRPPNQRPSSMRRQYGEVFRELNEVDEWQIEKSILKTCEENFPLWTPVTKGYESNGDSRKIYMGTFSYKSSAFKYFRH